MSDLMAIYQKLRRGGRHLAAARTFLQSNCPNGDRITWGSGDVVHLTVSQIEEMAMHVAAAALMEHAPDVSGTMR